MTRVDFYILPDQNRNNLQLFTCRLAEKAWQQGHRIMIQTGSADESHHLDDLLWTFKDGSFIPHAIIGSDADEEQPIMIGHEDMSHVTCDLLINISATTPQQQQFKRLAEVVNQEADCKQLGREHYKQYREQGFDLHHHEM